VGKKSQPDDVAQPHLELMCAFFLFREIQLTKDKGQRSGHLLVTADWHGHGQRIIRPSIHTGRAMVDS